jgi:hypothetical protein
VELLQNINLLNIIKYNCDIRSAIIQMKKEWNLIFVQYYRILNMSKSIIARKIFDNQNIIYSAKVVTKNNFVYGFEFNSI